MIGFTRLRDSGGFRLDSRNSKKKIVDKLFMTVDGFIKMIK